MGVPRFFVSVVYRRRGDGVSVPEIPGFGPCRQDDACEVSLEDWRERNTGPQHCLAVVHCKTHGVCFTLYPPGHVPYGRKPFAELTSEGVPIEKGRDPPFCDTYFDAALDAARGDCVARELSRGKRRAPIHDPMQAFGSL